jgi:aminoglycoside phosphotransferase (APT) family kinase protein
MLEEQNRISRIKNLKHVPKIVHASDQSSTNSKIYYLVLEYLQGQELLTIYNDLQDQNIQDIGIEIADFMLELHSIKGDKYDIGHYVPIIPGYDKSWRSGHEIYWEYIYKGLNDLQLSSNIQQILELSNEYIKANLSSLDFENGPALLHNDFHYKNIIIHDNTFSGVIDWECSQFGEADFDLIHLLHWCLFPTTKGNDLTLLFGTIFHRYRKKVNIPMLEKRLTIYLLEHDFIQMLWSQGKRADEFLPRIKWWLSGGLEKYILELEEG